MWARFQNTPSHLDSSLLRGNEYRHILYNMPIFSCDFSTKLKRYTSFDTAILFLGIYLKEQLDKRAKTYVKTIHYKIDYISRKVKIRKVKSRKSKRFWFNYIHLCRIITYNVLSTSKAVSHLILITLRNIIACCMALLWKILHSHNNANTEYWVNWNWWSKYI